MSTVSATKPTSTGWVRFAAWAVVCLATAAVVVVVATPVAGLVTGLAVALLGLAVSALTRASRTMDRIFEEELDPRTRHHRGHG
ncbi:hypothetical protein SUDANB95_06740 [Actinosynnema sp. ALI-1.44]